jgi:hypothetical protein
MLAHVASFLSRSPTGILLPLSDAPQSFAVDRAGKVFRTTGALHETPSLFYNAFVRPTCMLITICRLIFAGMSTVFITGSVTSFLQHIMR